MTTGVKRSKRTHRQSLSECLRPMLSFPLYQRSPSCGPNTMAISIRRRKRPVSAASVLAIAGLFVSAGYPMALAFTAVAPSPAVTWASTCSFTARPRPPDAYLRNNEEDYESKSFDFQPSHQAEYIRDKTDLPGWLSVPKSHRAIDSVRELQRCMRQSQLFSDLETRKLVYAMEVAARSDDQLLAGVSEFLLILVQMEMVYSALVAAAFHYCSSVNARRRGILNDREEPALVDVPVSQMLLFGDHAVDIAKDASRLKQLELMAAKLTTDTGVRSPNAKDAENLRKLLLSSTSDWRSLAIRCAASLYRLQGLEEYMDGQPQLTRETIRAAREALLIYSPMASRLGMRWLKNELDNSAFKLLYRRQYRRVQSYELYSSMEQVLTKVKTELTDLLARDVEFTSMVEEFSVTSRVKEPYSMWNKMLRYRYHHVLQVPDALALRIVLNAKRRSRDEPEEVFLARERALCYYAQKLCMDRWKPSIQPRIKDYIGLPKANGYQSLHYTAQDEEDWTLEIQVRTGQMHQIAEFGLASHWDYKALQKQKLLGLQAPPPKDSQSSDTYLRKVQEWHWQQRSVKSKHSSTAASDDQTPVSLGDIWQSKQRQNRIRERAKRLQPYLNALTEAQSDLARDYVFVFLNSLDHPGRVLALPSGACVIDALREGEKAVGCPLVYDQNDLAVNGVSASMTRQLSNGDVLSLPLCVV